MHQKLPRFDSRVKWSVVGKVFQCDETLSQVRVYLAEGSYPLGATDDVRRIIRKRSKDFQIDGDCITQNKKVNGLSFSETKTEDGLLLSVMRLPVVGIRA